MGRETVGDDAELLARLRARDEAAFAELLGRLHSGLLAAARAIVPTAEIAQEAVQDTWLSVVRNLDGFEGRSSLSTWIYTILINRARTLAARERRTASSAAYAATPAGDGDGEDDEPGLGAAGRWEQPPAPWGLDDPAAAMASRETLEVVERALATLPEAQRLAVVLRDVEGLPAGDACNILAVSESNLRVLLHRGRQKVRRALDQYMKEGTRPSRPPPAGKARR
ncbi:MAG: sigma-70 family RNA polymerase sigma factor [Candidatus Eisenbacteria bacterium]|nr:sigma-70 family RNA polymerase sigma factor [Candidatus Eisenbacteria bacterium]